jgi:hypothetical protein
MANVKWDDSNYKKSTVTKALDGVEECVKGLMLTQAREDCPVKTGTLRDEGLGTERDDANKCIYLGAGGPAKDYAKRQELDRSLNHRVGKAGFIRDSVEMHASKLNEYVEKHIKD